MTHPDWPLLVALGREFQEENPDAAGVAIQKRDGGIVVLKAPGRWDLLVRDPAFDYLTAFPAISAICHVRHATTGSPKVNRNNHPLVVGKVVGVHHGVIYNHRQIKVKRQAEVDSEVIFCLLDDQRPLEGLKGWGAVAHFDTRHPGKTFLGVSNFDLRMESIGKSHLFVSGPFGGMLDTPELGPSDCIYSLDLLGNMRVEMPFELDSISREEADRLMGWNRGRKGGMERCVPSAMSSHLQVKITGSSHQKGGEMIDHRDEHFTPAEARAKVGQRVRSRIAFSGVPKGTTGIVLEPDRKLVTLPIQWDLPGRSKPLVDWFSKSEYKDYLEEIAR